MSELKEVFEAIGINPVIGATITALFGALPKLQETWEAWRGEEKDVKANKTFLEHLKIRLEVQALAKAAGQDPHTLHLPPLPHLPNIAKPLTPADILSPKGRLLACLFGTSAVLIPIGLILAILGGFIFNEDSNLLEGFFFILSGGAVFLSAGYAIAIFFSKIPFRHRWQAGVFSAIATLTIFSIIIHAILSDFYKSISIGI
ncbi:hypothetical protein [Zoogloea sp.]|uniref:hypothetical protein n=1 Tax=Zoogloea sp. TaxID=49181 RepID=UPI0035B4D1C8